MGGRTAERGGGGREGGRCYKGYASSYAATEPSIGRDATSTESGLCYSRRPSFLAQRL
jgi:hypothetical protein